jgi:hypothetical protein
LAGSLKGISTRVSGAANRPAAAVSGRRMTSCSPRIRRVSWRASAPPGSSSRLAERVGMKAEDRAPSARSLRRLLGTVKTAFHTSAAPEAPNRAPIRAIFT